MTEHRNLTEADAEAIAEKVNQKLFEGFGFDISTTQGRLEAAGAFRHLMFWYRISGAGFKTAIGTGMAAGAVWIIWKLTGWSGPPN